MSKLGNKTKLSSMTGAHEYNNDFDNLLRDADHGRLRPKTRADFERPAYYGTSQCRVPYEGEYDGRRLYAKSAERGD